MYCFICMCIHMYLQYRIALEGAYTFFSLDLKLDFIFAVGKEVELGSHSLLQTGVNFITKHRVVLES